MMIRSGWSSRSRLSVVIVSWNCRSLLQSCLESISNSEIVSEIIVVDNASEDGSCDALAQYYPNATVIELDENVGFGKACNLGAKLASGDFLLFLNPDAAASSSALVDVAEFMDKPESADVGICGVQLLDASEQVSRSCSRFPSVARILAHAIGLDRLDPRFGSSMADWPHDSTRTVDQLIGAFFVVRRSLFECLGGFDERFFVYFEEVDFSLRARREGWRSVYLADVQAFHLGGGSSQQVKSRRLFYSLRSRLIYSSKHFGPVGVAAVFFATMILEPFSRGMQALLQRSWSTFRETLHGYALLWCWVPRWIFFGATR